MTMKLNRLSNSLKLIVVVLLYIHGLRGLSFDDINHYPKGLKVVSKSKLNDIHEILIMLVPKRIQQHQDLLHRSTPGDALFQRWHTEETVNDTSDVLNDYRSVINWFEQHNIRVNTLRSNVSYLRASTNVETWNKVLNTTFYTIEDSRQGPKSAFYHRCNSVTLPLEIQPYISGLMKTTQIPILLPQALNTYNDVTSDPVSRLRKLPVNAPTTVQFINKLYNVTSNEGDITLSQMILAMDKQGFYDSDLELFQTRNGFTLQPAIRMGNNSQIICNENICSQGNLNVQYLMGVAQKSKTYFYNADHLSTSLSGDPFLDMLLTVGQMSSPPSVIVIPWTVDERSHPAIYMDAFNDEALKLSLRGVTILVSAGDNGVSGDTFQCTSDSSSSTSSWSGANTWSGQGYFPVFPASSPYVLTVGGTMGPNTGGPEVGCQSDNGGTFTTGGGFSTYFQQPSYQNDAVNTYLSSTTGQSASPGYNSKGRAYPDISLIGVQFSLALNGQFFSFSGTSASVTVAAAMISLINAQRKAIGLGTVGYINPILYRNTDKFTDVTSGNNKRCGLNATSAGFKSSNGWDPVSGLGSIQFHKLMNMLVTPAVNGPTMMPSLSPTYTPTNVPTYIPTQSPTITPTLSPTQIPTNSPTLSPTYVPTMQPSLVPTNMPSDSPTIIPSIYPTLNPSVNPTSSPTIRPTLIPSTLPTLYPSITPTFEPTYKPTMSPTNTLTMTPTMVPTLYPSLFPSIFPSPVPTLSPTDLSVVTPDPTITTIQSPRKTSTLTPTMKPQESTIILIQSNGISDNPKSNNLIFILLFLIMAVILIVLLITCFCYRRYITKVTKDFAFIGGSTTEESFKRDSSKGNNELIRHKTSLLDLSVYDSRADYDYDENHTRDDEENESNIYNSTSPYAFAANVSEIHMPKPRSPIHKVMSQHQDMMTSEAISISSSSPTTTKPATTTSPTTTAMRDSTTAGLSKQLPYPYHLPHTSNSTSTKGRKSPIAYDNSKMLPTITARAIDRPHIRRTPKELLIKDEFSDINVLNAGEVLKNTTINLNLTSFVFNSSHTSPSPDLHHTSSDKAFILDSLRHMSSRSTYSPRIDDTRYYIQDSTINISRNTDYSSVSNAIAVRVDDTYDIDTESELVDILEINRMNSSCRSRLVPVQVLEDVWHETIRYCPSPHTTTTTQHDTSNV